MTAAGVGPAREPPVENMVETTVPLHERTRVILAMFFLPHYRGPVVRALLSSPRHEYLLAGETADVVDGSIETWQIPASVDFIHTPYLRLFGIFGWLRGTLRLALRRDVDVIVYHADPHLLSTWVSAALARLTGKRVLFSTIGWFHHDTRFRTLLKKVYFRIPHGLLLYGHAAKMIGLQRGLPCSCSAMSSSIACFLHTLAWAVAPCCSSVSASARHCSTRSLTARAPLTSKTPQKVGDC